MRYLIVLIISRQENNLLYLLPIMLIYVDIDVRFGSIKINYYRKQYKVYPEK